MSEYMVIRANLPDFTAKLKAMEQKLASRVIRASLATASRTLARAVKAQVPIGPEGWRSKGVRRQTGALKRSVYAGRTKLMRGSVTSFVSAYSGGKNATKRRDGYYAPWVEYGHVARGPGQRVRGGARRKAVERRNLKSTGAWVPGKFYFKQGFRMGQQQAVNAFYQRLQRGIAELK